MTMQEITERFFRNKSRSIECKMLYRDDGNDKVGSEVGVRERR